MDPSFYEMMENLGAMQDKANEQHRAAMTEANVPLATLGREHATAMDEADSRLGSLSHHERDTAENSERLHSHASEHEREIEEANRRLKYLGADDKGSPIGKAGSG
ncbi:hypothetical protein F4777DRAFT_219529 [Nemania sp. FL0916]|nr:hypothetical protein F4777DRAFT_219529 [Nemania sp. FL0916]